MADDTGLPGKVKVLLAGCFVSLILGVGLVGAAVYLVFEHYEHAGVIDAVLDQDVETVDVMGDIGDVVAAMEAIDLSECPEDFQAAYRDYIEAWRTFAELEDRMPGYDEIYDLNYELKEAAMYGSTPDVSKLDLTDAEKAAILAEWEAASTAEIAAYDRLLDVASSYGSSGSYY